ncbi:23S rRNA (guanosine(2251)-2'-O)-methyltransferase [hydrothermal vent metagenome]|uniref:23S rRNA (Guanosine(2251)-2'-O)-methyltransferase n=1 Tax=hydrothermal vent metagenome TaxID=652676 RepID=A0A3B0W812_9ZZZZ
MKQDVIYGLHAVEKFVKQAPHLVYQLSFIKGRLNNRQQSLYDYAKSLGLSPEFTAKSAFNKIDGNHQGVMAQVAKQADLNESNLLSIMEKAINPLFIFLDEVQDPHNLGAVLRTADAVGVDAVIIPKHNSVGMNATVRKVASGAADNVKLIVVSNLTRTLKEMQQAGMWMVGLDGDTEQTIYDQDFTGSTGIVMGAEGTGLRRLTREVCDYLAAIPMVGVVESLNVSVATGITVYEVYRQRQFVSKL